MWRAYTREKPARPGWGLVIVAIASVACLGLAGWMVESRNAFLASLVPQSLGPIEFGVPEGFSCKRSTSDSIEEDEPGGSALYNGSTGGPSATLDIEYKRLSPSTGAIEVLAHFIDPDQVLVEPQTLLSPMGLRVDDQEFVIVQYVRSGDIHVAAVTSRPDGLAVSVKYQTKSWDTTAETTVRAICRSIRFKDMKEGEGIGSH